MAIAGRAAALIGCWMVYTLLMDRSSDPSAGPNIGTGLLGFALLALAAACWAVIDGRRGAPLASLLVRWGVVAVIVGIVLPMVTFIRSGGPSVQLLVQDLAVVGPLVAGLLFAPAAIGAASGAVLASRRTHPG